VSIAAEVLPNRGEFACGRLTMKADYDSAERKMSFLVPSLSRGERVYLVEVSTRTAECVCACEAFQFRGARNSPYHIDKVGVYAEHLARTKGENPKPLITRNPKGLCPHCRRVRSWIKRHGLWGAVLTVEKSFIDRLEAAPSKGRTNP
jgi:hypothetical protein